MRAKKVKAKLQNKFYFYGIIIFARVHVRS